MTDLLFEIGTEEIPARFMKRALQDLKTNAADLLQKARLSFKAINVLGTDRRLALIVKELAEKQTDFNQELKGPPKRIACDQKGNFTEAAVGFAKKSGINIQDISFKKFGAEEYLYIEKKEKGSSAKNILPEILTQLVSSIHLPIAMRWGNLDFQFVRPIHWLVCLLGTTVVPFEIAGIKTGAQSVGHRFLCKKPIVIKSALTYEKTLAEGSVIVDPEKRKTRILKGLAKIAQKHRLTVVENAALLDEVVFINEMPDIVESTIQHKYLFLPQEVLITSMQKNQKYFTFVDKKEKLSPVFALTANGLTAKNKKNILEGNHSVLGARLEDAQFFYEEDKKMSLEKMVGGLKTVVYQEKIGTIYQKVERISKIAEWLSDKLQVTAEEKENIKRTAFICKGDLNSKMVYEFPELQGVMGTYYAKVQGESPIVAQAVGDHWKPRYAGEDISSISNVAAIVSIADKIDSITGCFSAELVPSSSSDPYALRRAAQGIVALMLDKKIEISLYDLVSYGLSLHKAELLQSEIIKFFRSRIKFVLQEKSVQYDIVEAVLAVLHEDVLAAVHIGLALNNFAKKVDYNKFVDTGVRVYRLSKNVHNTVVNPEVFSEEIEKELFTILQKTELEVQKALVEKKYDAVLNSLYTMVAPVDLFFEKVLVMDNDEQKKNNRLSILKRLDRLFKQIGDFEKLVVKG